MRQHSIRFRQLPGLWLLLVSLLLAGCAIKLAPEFDPDIVEGLTSANEEAMTLFASISGGASKESFAEYEPSYNQLIGQFDALRLEAQARPDPSTPSLIDVVSEQLPALDEIAKLETPTPEILENIVTTLTQMRDDHQNDGLKVGAVTLFKASFETKMDQALTYEKALER